LDGIPVGAVSFGDIEDYSYIHEIQILPEYQGRGIGSQFLRERIEAARSVGKSLKLKALRENKAKHLYLRMGFVSYEENVVEIKMVWRSPQIL
jgi:GNAT superfamily N-acetyltransferase